jgi:uncharacterized membrane-anchored protein YjiN (DUF445 family)
MNKIFPLIIIVLFSVIFYAIFQEITKTSKVKRLECQSHTTTYEKRFIETPIEDAIKSFESNNYEIVSEIKYSKFMKSHLVEILTKEQSDKILEKVIQKYINKDSATNEKVLIDYYIYENDKEDSGKKNDKAKLYAGYLVFEFKYENKLVYKIQTDYMNIDATDLQERMDCVINSFISLKN